LPDGRGESKKTRNSEALGERSLLPIGKSLWEKAHDGGFKKRGFAFWKKVLSPFLALKSRRKGENCPENMTNKTFVVAQAKIKGKGKASMGRPEGAGEGAEGTEKNCQSISTGGKQERKSSAQRVLS